MLFKKKRESFEKEKQETGLNVKQVTHQNQHQHSTTSNSNSNYD